MSAVGRIIFSGMKVLLDQEWVSQRAIVIEAGKIKAILPEEMIQHHLPAEQYVFAEDNYLIPGLIDLHVHGAKGCDVMDADQKALETMSIALAAEGVTGYLATTMTASAERIEAALQVVAAHLDSEVGAAILGVHLEGPFIAKEKIGAQCGEAVCLPSVPLMARWQEIANDCIKIVTLAPELPGALDLVAALRKQGVVASLGHTNASYEEAEAMIAAGCTNATHLFNAMSGLRQREPGVALAVLLSTHVTAELIVDGLHVHPAMIDLAMQMKGKDKLVLVTDAMRAKCLGDGIYELGGQSVAVVDGRAALQDGTLAGSTLRMPEALKNMVQFAGCPLEVAVHMATYVPARVLGLLGAKGSIEVGKDADLVLMDKRLEVGMTMRDGRVIFKGEKS